MAGGGRGKSLSMSYIEIAYEDERWKRLNWSNQGMDDEELAQKISSVGSYSRLSVETLMLSGNELRNPWPSLLKLKNIQSLLLQRNDIEFVPAEIVTTLGQLSYLNLSNNALRTLPRRLREMRTLSALHLSGNDLLPLRLLSGRTEKNLQDIWTVFGHNKVVKATLTWLMFAKSALPPEGKDIWKWIGRMVYDSEEDSVWDNV